jgi:hypothetical protein
MIGAIAYSGYGVGVERVRNDQTRMLRMFQVDEPGPRSRFYPERAQI